MNYHHIAHDRWNTAGTKQILIERRMRVNAEPIDSSARLLALFPKELLMLFNSIALTSSPLSSASKSQFLVGRNQPGNVHMRPWS